MEMNAAVPSFLREPIETYYIANNKRPNHCGRPRVEAIRKLAACGKCSPDAAYNIVSREDSLTHWVSIVNVAGVYPNLRLTAPITTSTDSTVKLTIEPAV